MLNIAIVLRPFSALYGLVLKLRHRLYDRGLLKSSPGPNTTIVVGNLELGGTGKSPMTGYILGLLENEYATGLLSRGYGRQSSGFVEINEEATAASVGDEPLMLSQAHPKVKAAVCEDRITGLETLAKRYPLDIVVLDDAFQHRKLRSGFNVLVTRFERPFWDNQLVPEGSLRDVKKRAKKAHVIVVNRSPEDLSVEEQAAMKAKAEWYTAAPVFFTSVSYSSFRSLGGQTLDKLPVSRILVFSGIADDSQFVKQLGEAYEILHVVKYRDHHRYTPADMRKLKEISATFGDGRIAMVTTAKDVVKLTSKDMKEVVSDMDIYYLPIELNFLNKGFDDIIKGYARANKRNN